MSNARNIARLLPSSSGLIPDTNLAQIPTTKLSGAIQYSNFPSGTVLQCNHTSSGFTRQYIGASSPVLLSGMSVTITPKYSSSKIIIMASVTMSYTHVSSMHLLRNGSAFVTNHGGNSNSGAGTSLWTHYDQGIGGGSGSVTCLPVHYIDFPSTTSATTYALAANACWSGSAYGLYFNDRDSNDMLGGSWMTVWEVAV